MAGVLAEDVAGLVLVLQVVQAGVGARVPVDKTNNSSDGHSQQKYPEFRVSSLGRRERCIRWWSHKKLAISINQYINLSKIN